MGPPRRAAATAGDSRAAAGVPAGGGFTRPGAPARRAKAIVGAVVHYKEPQILAELSEDLGEAMVGIGLSELDEQQRMAVRGW